MQFFSGFVKVEPYEWAYFIYTVEWQFDSR